jgi:hypothetical protein
VAKPRPYGQLADGCMQRICRHVTRDLDRGLDTNLLGEFGAMRK